MQKFLMICALVLTGNLFAMDHATDNNSDSSNSAEIHLADLSANADAQPEGLSPAVIRALAGEPAPAANNDQNAAGMRTGLDPGLLHFDNLPHLNEAGLALANEVLMRCYNDMPEADRIAVVFEALRGNFEYGHFAHSFWDMLAGWARPMRGIALLASTVAPIVSFSLELSEPIKNIIITVNGVCSVIALILSEIQSYADADRQSWKKTIILMKAIQEKINRHDSHNHDDQEDHTPLAGGAEQL